MFTPENVNLHGYTFGVYSYSVLRMAVHYELSVRNYINTSVPFPPRSMPYMVDKN